MNCVKIIPALALLASGAASAETLRFNKPYSTQESLYGRGTRLYSNYSGAANFTHFKTWTHSKGVCVGKGKRAGKSAQTVSVDSAYVFNTGKDEAIRMQDGRITYFVTAELKTSWSSLNPYVLGRIQLQCTFNTQGTDATEYSISAAREAAKIVSSGEFQIEP